MSMQRVLQAEHLQQVAMLRQQFSDAKPFKHLCLPNFLCEPFYRDIQREFPSPEQDAMRSEFGDRSLKHTCEHITALGEAFRFWDATLRSREFIQWLEQVTGIEGLIFDPTYEGAGTHNNLHGQSLDLHIDFNHHHATRQHRRLNLIVYLNDGWDETWGGAIELHKDAWDRRPDREWVSYPPGGKMAVLFETNEHSWHGFREIRLPENKRHLSRKSLTVYYYSEDRPEAERAPDHSTIYVPDWIPESVVPGEVLSQDAYRELVTVMTRRDHYLQRLYARETDLQDRYSKAMRFLLPVRRVLRRLGLLSVLRKLSGRQ
jgi:Rps23 Pro-64 3,4-dihydroxylase Tpa1-like proline 4-hydroxylase